MTKINISRPEPIASLEKQLRTRFPKAAIEVDGAERPRGTIYLDVVLEGHRVTVQWKPGSALGVSCAVEAAYGEGADELYPDVESCYGRVVSLLLSRTYTSPPPAVRIGALRAERGLSQMQLAELLQVKQATLSRFENQNDALISTVREAVQAMGGELVLSARFPDGTVRPIVYGPAAGKSKAAEQATPLRKKRT